MQSVLSIRSSHIAQARQAILQVGDHVGARGIASWITQSWQRCLSWGLRPEQPVVFDMVTAAQVRRTADANQRLVQVAAPVLQHLGHTLRHTGYFAILTNADGVVVDVSGAIDKANPRAHLITRIGTDLSEKAVGTTAIGSALRELRPVWLHQGEHFFQDTGHYSCAGAPLTGPDGQCIGMLDLTGIDVPERPELQHLVAQSARKIENALVLAQPHKLVLRLGWPGDTLGSESDGILCLDADGAVTGFNPAALQMVSGLAGPPLGTLHASDVFALPYHLLFDAARSGRTVDLPLWSGLRVQALALHTQTASSVAGHLPGGNDTVPLKTLEANLIRRAVEQAQGNVALAAQTLGISRATVYRKLNQRGN